MHFIGISDSIESIRNITVCLESVISLISFCITQLISAIAEDLNYVNI